MAGRYTANRPRTNTQAFRFDQKQNQNVFEIDSFNQRRLRRSRREKREERRGKREERREKREERREKREERREKREERREKREEGRKKREGETDPLFFFGSLFGLEDEVSLNKRLQLAPISVSILYKGVLEKLLGRGSLKDVFDEALTDEISESVTPFV